MQCKRCVMDTTSVNITFDNEGNCNYCSNFLKQAQRTIFRPSELRYNIFKNEIEEIKTKGKGKKYDCIIGVSGGIDSSYMVLLAKDYGLKPLLVHFDNGWDDELAVKNINNLVNYSGFDLYTYVIDWEGFKDMQKAYFKAGVIDLEVPTDMFISGTLIRIAKKNNVKTILSGANLWTEAILPRDWIYSKKNDFVNMSNIYKLFGDGILKKIPHYSINKRIWNEILGYKFLTVFEKLDFNQENVKKRLINELGYRVYPCKHFESIFTRFYQGYYLRKKFNIDKRKAHLSNLIMVNQLSREDALKEISEEPYDLNKQKEDLEYVTKKWGYSIDEFMNIMNKKPIEHSFYGEEDDSPNWYLKFIKYIELVYLYKFAYPLGIKAKPIS
jgi:N-acetyl sugar amidotransferase